jgi:hypothetical protein
LNDGTIKDLRICVAGEKQLEYIYRREPQEREKNTKKGTYSRSLVEAVLNGFFQSRPEVAEAFLPP